MWCHNSQYLQEACEKLTRRQDFKKNCRKELAQIKCKEARTTKLAQIIMMIGQRHHILIGMQGFSKAELDDFVQTLAAEFS